MINIVMDTNVIVSSLLVPGSNPAKVLALVLNEKVNLCYDSRILLEYETVLRRPKFPFEPSDITGLIGTIMQIGIATVAEPSREIFVDETDKNFYEVAKQCNAKVITGTLKHFPEEPDILNPASFLEQYYLL